MMLPLILVLTIIPVVWGLVFIIHRLFVHRLNSTSSDKYPSLAAFCSITNLGYTIHLLLSDTFRSRQLHQAHSDHSILRLGPSRLSFRDPSAIEAIYGYSSKCLKGDIYTTVAGPHTHLVNSVDREEHAIKRKRLAPAFALKHMRMLEYKILDKVERLVVQLDKYSTSSEHKALDFRKWSNLFTIEVMMDLALSMDPGMLKAGNDSIVAENLKGEQSTVSFVDGLHGFSCATEPILWSPNLYHIMGKFSKLFSSFRRQWKHSDNFSDVLRYVINQREQKIQDAGQSLDDFYSRLKLTKNEGGIDKSLPRGEIAAEVGMLLNAGTDTTAIALTHVIYLLILNPDKLNKLRVEISRYIQNKTLPTYSDVEECEYLFACINESLRLYPPLSSGLQRITPKSGVYIAGHYIAGNVNVSIPAYTAHRDASIFPEPDNFVPERWLGENRKTIGKHFIAFSAGSRGCMGKNITYMEQSILIATLVMRYDFELYQKEMQWVERFNLWPQSLWVKLRKRSITQKRCL